MADPVLSEFVDQMSGWFVLSRARPGGERATGVVVLGEAAGRDVSLPPERPNLGLFCRTDHLGNWSVERITPPPTDAE